MQARRSFPLIALVALIFVAVACTSDAGVTTKIKAKMATDDNVKAYQIDVATQNGVVTLTGNIDSQEAKNRALEIARDTKGVTSVVDMISVKTAAAEGNAPSPERSLGEHIDDAGITLKVKSRLLEDPDVKGLQIDVDTREGVVFLTGKVRSEAEKEKAINLAKQTEGVRDVQANLSISSS
ncbi:MAG TPA: BON domain-containing protein [Candidatus Polarisedimenticolia bacterium]|jgi:hyperosmotically inducible protein|nr:BON domain-containing protein [Candidatus Polarisedimenticolia bacterium]